MGTIIGAVAGVVLFSIFGFLPAFLFGSSLVLYMLYKITGRSVEPTSAARAFIIAGALLSILCGAAIPFFGGALLGSIFLLYLPLHDLSVSVL
jgi:hypothetical protein